MLYVFVVHSGAQHILCGVFVLFVFVLLPVSLDCPLLIALSVLCNVYLYMCDFDFVFEDDILFDDMTNIYTVQLVQSDT
jgi:hypothetical protein